VFTAHLFQDKKAEAAPVLYLLDSLPADRSEAINNIRDYLSQEWKQRVHGNKETFHTFDNSEMEFICPVLPRQQNGFDCGIFLLTYLEKLFER
jgi:Ulp1 family protease